MVDFTQLGVGRGNEVHATITLTDTTETTLLAAWARGYLDLTKLMIANTSATGVRVDIRDDTGGTVIASVYVPAGETRGFVDSLNPVRQSASNKNWTAKLSASVTDVRVFAQAIRNEI